MSSAAPTPPPGFEVSILGITANEHTGRPETTVLMNGSTVKVAMEGSEALVSFITLAGPDSVGFAGRRYLSRLAQSIEADYAESITAAQSRITADLTKAYAA